MVCHRRKLNSQVATIIQPSTANINTQLEDPVLALLGLGEDLGFRRACQVIREQLRSPHCSLEKRAYMQSLLGNEDRLYALLQKSKQGGEQPQEAQLTKEQLIEQLMTMAQAPILALSPPELPESKASFQAREDKLLHQILVSNSKFMSCA